MHITIHTCGEPVGGDWRRGRFAGLFPPCRGLWKTDSEWLVYTSAPALRRRRSSDSETSSFEAHLPAERPPPQAQARLPRAHGDPRRPGDPEAAPRQGPQAALRLTRPVYPRHRAPPPPPVPLAGLRRRLSQRPLRLDPIPRPLLVPSLGARRDGRASSRTGGAEVGRECGRAQPRQAAAARDVGRARRPGPPRVRLRPRRAPGPRRAGRHARAGVARRARDRGAREGRRVSGVAFGAAGVGKYVGIGLVYAWRYSLGLLTPSNTCKYHPTCSQYALDALHRYGLVRGG